MIDHPVTVTLRLDADKFTAGLRAVLTNLAPIEGELASDYVRRIKATDSIDRLLDETIHLDA